MRVAVGTALVALVVGGCSSGAAPAPSGSGPAGSPPSLTAVLHQTRTDVAVGVVQVLTGNDGKSPVRLTSVELGWPGFAEPARTDLMDRFPPDGYPLAAGLRADMPIQEPTSVGCGSPRPTAADATAVFEVGGASPQRLTIADADSLALLRRLWGEACTQQQVASQVTVGFGSRWVPSTVGTTPALRGTITLTRTAATGPTMSITSLSGSVLLAMVPVGRDGPPLVTMSAGQGAAQLRVDLLTTGRCDGHGLSESSTTFALAVKLAVGAAAPVTVLVSPDAADRPRLLDVIYAGCGLTRPPTAGP